MVFCKGTTKLERIAFFGDIRCIIYDNMIPSDSFIDFFDVSFSWPDPETGLAATDAEGKPLPPLFHGFTGSIPQGFISLTGPNGSGKSTFMLLASGRIFPSSGRVELFGKNTRIVGGLWADDAGTPGPGLTERIESSRNSICSFIYQNMEFDEQAETAGSIGSVLEIVSQSGGASTNDQTFFNHVVETFELTGLLNRKMNHLSKGETQRLLLALSALYGSKSIVMDEPIFALEQRQKEKSLEFFRDIYREKGVSIMVSLHELALTRKYAETVLLFHPDRRMEMGSPEEVLTKESLEAAYGVPAAMLHDAETSLRQAMLERLRA